MMPLRWQGCSGIRFLAPVAFATRALPLLSQGVSGSLYLAPVAIATRALPLLLQGISGIRYLAPVAIATRASPLLSQGLSFATILVFCGIVSAGSTGDPRSFALECPAAYRLRALKFQTRYLCLFFAYVRPRHQGFRSVTSAEPQRKILISALAFAESAQDLAPACPRCHRLPQHLSGPSSRPWASQRARGAAPRVQGIHNLLANGDWATTTNRHAACPLRAGSALGSPFSHVRSSITV